MSSILLYVLPAFVFFLLQCRYSLPLYCHLNLLSPHKTDENAALHLLSSWLFSFVLHNWQILCGETRISLFSGLPSFHKLFLQVLAVSIAPNPRGTLQSCKVSWKGALRKPYRTGEIISLPGSSLSSMSRINKCPVEAGFPLVNFLWCLAWQVL